MHAPSEICLPSLTKNPGYVAVERRWEIIDMNILYSYSTPSIVCIRF